MKSGRKMNERPRRGASSKSRNPRPSTKSGWVKPDGTPLRKRKGDYFPDQEIDKRKYYKPPRVSGNERDPEASDGNERRNVRDAGSPARKYGDRKPEQRGAPDDRRQKAERPAYRDRDSKSERPAYRDRDSKSERPAYRDRDSKTERPAYRDRDSKSERPAYRDRDSKSERPAYRSKTERSQPDRKGKSFAGKNRGNYKPDRRDEKKFSRTGSGKPTATGAVRLNKYIANAGICSRREADDLITAGVISINGEVVTELGTKVQPGDVVRYHEQTLRTEKPVYVLLNKPKDYITTTDDPDQRKTVMALVEDACRERIFPVGRLDRNTTGLLLFTNDGDLTKKLTHPSGNVRKIYQVELDKNITRGDMQATLDGVELEDGPAAFDVIEYDHSGDKSMVGVELHSGRNRVVRRMFEALGYQVRKLDRVMFAGLTKKDLPRGRWRFLTEMEINSLKMQIGRGTKP